MYDKLKYYVNVKCPKHAERSFKHLWNQNLQIDLQLMIFLGQRQIYPKYKRWFNEFKYKVKLFDRKNIEKQNEMSAWIPWYIWEQNKMSSEFRS